MTDSDAVASASDATFNNFPFRGSGLEVLSSVSKCEDGGGVLLKPIKGICLDSQLDTGGHKLQSSFSHASHASRSPRVYYVLPLYLLLEAPTGKVPWTFYQTGYYTF